MQVVAVYNNFELFSPIFSNNVSIKQFINKISNIINMSDPCGFNFSKTIAVLLFMKAKT